MGPFLRPFPGNEAHNFLGGGAGQIGCFSGTKNEPKPKLLSPDIFRWGRGLPREGVGAKKFGMPFETREIKLFWRDIPGFCRNIPEVPEKFEKKMFGFKFRSLVLGGGQKVYVEQMYVPFRSPSFLTFIKINVVKLLSWPSL